ncbi:MAG: mechanosensitive ion channel [Isosphaeraceae bacterium]
MRTLRSLLLGFASSAVWPMYLGLVGYAARQAPWSRSMAIVSSTVIVLAALALFAAKLISWVFAAGGWAERELEVPAAVALQARRAGLLLLAAHVVFLIPVYILNNGLFAPGGRPVPAPGIVRGLVLGFELSVLGLAVAVTRRNSPLLGWLAQFPERLRWLNNNQRAVVVALIALIVGVIVLDAAGFSYSAHRLSTGLAGTIVTVAIARCVHQLNLRAIDRHAWRWIRLGKSLAGLQAPGEKALPHELSDRLRRLSLYASIGIGLMLASRAWDVDLALFQFIGEQPLWSTEKDVATTVGDLAKAIVILSLTGLVWKHLSTCFAVAVFPRMPDDPGVRFAVVTLCRYAVLGIGVMAGLSAIHLGVEKIGMVLAALGVGLGFGLQEIVSNFICGIILLLERPIRVGDIVTVSGMTGKVDRINIRATTITNGDNQSMIVPNRAFITSDLVNWTLKDKIIRVTMRVRVAVGTDPDRVAELLLAIAREDLDVLRNPAPSAQMEEFSESSLIFNLYAHVPDPSVAGRVRHRLFAQIQRRFEAEGIQIPLPTQRLLVKPVDFAAGASYAMLGDVQRIDAPAQVPASPHWNVARTSDTQTTGDRQTPAN